MDQSDALTKYWMSLPPMVRLGYCLVSRGEKALLEAMCCFSTDGAAVDRSLPTLARRAGMTRKSAQRLLNGYKNGSREVPGLKSRAVVTEQAPSKTKVGKKTKPAVLHINWEALVLDPAKKHILWNKMQRPLPGMKTRPDPEEDPRAETPQPGAPLSGKTVDLPVNFIPPPGHSVQGGRTSCPAPPGHCVQGPPDIVSREEVGFAFGSSGESSVQKASAGDERGVVQILPASAGTAVSSQPVPKAAKPKKSAWDALHPGLYRKLKHELDLLGDSHTNMYGWTCEQVAGESQRRVLIACERAGIWRHVADQLALETYDIVLAEERRNREAN